MTQETTPTPAAPTQDLQAQLAQHLADIAHKHASVSFLLIGVLVVVVGLAGLGGYLGLRAYDAQLARQDAKDAQYQLDRKSFMDTLAANESLRAAEAQQIADLEAQIRTRDAKPLPKPIIDGLKPNATATEVIAAITAAYSNVPGFGVAQSTPDGQNVSLSPLQGQATVQAKVTGDRAVSDLKDTQGIVAQLKQSNSSFSNDLEQCKVLNVKAEADIAGYKKLAHKSRWQKFLGGAEKALLFAGGVYLGHRL